MITMIVFITTLGFTSVSETRGEWETISACNAEAKEIQADLWAELGEGGVAFVGCQESKK